MVLLGLVMTIRRMTVVYTLNGANIEKRINELCKQNIKQNVALAYKV
jgi:hypothetical protein